MLRIQTIKSNKRAFTLIEAIISVAVVSVLFLAGYGLVILSLQITSDNADKVEALGIANLKMEKIRNMAYDDVGTILGSIPGLIPAVETVAGRKTYTVTTYLRFEDDAYDGTVDLGTDSIGTDYKIVTVEVAWMGKFGLKNVTVFSKIIPRTEETSAGYGLLKLFVVDANGNPVPSASVRVQKTAPAMDTTNLTNSSGILYLPVVQALQAYRVSISKPGYGTDFTFDTSSGMGKDHLSVTDGVKTEESFSIDRLATLNIQTVSSNLPANWMAHEATSTMTDKNKAKVTTDNANNLYFTFQDDSIATSAVFIQKFNSAKVRQWADDVRVANTNEQVSPDAITDAAGKTYVVWQDNSMFLKLFSANNSGSKMAMELRDDKNSLLATTIKNYYHASKNIFINSYEKAKKSVAIIARHLIEMKKIVLREVKKIASSIKNFTLSQDSLAAGPIVPVQTKIGAIVGNGTTMTATFNSIPTAGNVIVAIAMRRNDGTFNNPTNTNGAFSLANVINTNNMFAADIGIGIWYKVATAGEPQQVTITATSIMDGGVLMIMEVPGLDIANPLNVVASNDQTGSSGTVANTNSTAVSVASGFAVAAIGLADDDFDTPNSTRWSSVSADSWTHRLWQDWSTASDGSLGVATMDVTAAAVQRATLSTTGGGNEERASVIAVFRQATPNQVDVGSIGGQTASMMIPSDNQYVGGAFVISETGGNHTVNSIKITESGSVDAQNDLSDVKLYYDIDSSAPYDCADESFDVATDSQFGVAQTFDSANGAATFVNAPIGITTTNSLCVYALVDIDSSANKDSTLEISINSPSSDVVLNADLPIPATAIDISGLTNLLAPAEFDQVHFRFRNDDGDEATATWIAGQDEPILRKQNDHLRLRFEMINAGSIASLATQFKIQYGEKITTCNAASWVDTPNDNSKHWRVIDSANLTDNNPTTDNAGLNNEGTIFAPGTVSDTGNTSAAITLSPTDFTEIEYSIEATANSLENTYCFRLTNVGGTGDFSYSQYPEASVKGDENIYIVEVDSAGNKSTVKKVNSDTTDTDQTNPRIAITEKLGDATTTIVWEDERNGDKDIYLQIIDHNRNKMFVNDLQITSSLGDETSPSVAIDLNDDIILTWVEAGDIFIRKLDLTGNILWGVAKNITNSADIEFAPEITTDGSGNIYVAWTKLTGVDYAAELSKFDASGSQVWLQNANIESNASNQLYPKLSLKNSDIFTIWTDNRKGNNDIYSQKFDLNGVSAWAADQKINDDSVMSDQQSCSLLINTAGLPYAAWQDRRNGMYDIYSVNINDPAANTPRANVPLQIVGTRKISMTPVIAKYNQTIKTNGSGVAAVQFEWDTAYTITASSTLTTLEVDRCEPEACPFGILPNETKNITVILK